MTAQPQVIYMSFAYGNSTDANNDVIADYSDNASATLADTTTLVHGSQIVFNNNDVRTAHSASGLGQSGFPSTFTNTSGATASGTTIDGGMTWSTGRVGAGTVSTAFTLGPAGTYYYGCVYHYESSQMEDIIISQ